MSMLRTIDGHVAVSYPTASHLVCIILRSPGLHDSTTHAQLENNGDGGVLQSPPSIKVARGVLALGIALLVADPFIIAARRAEAFAVPAIPVAFGVVAITTSHKSSPCQFAAQPGAHSVANPGEDFAASLAGGRL